MIIICPKHIRWFEVEIDQIKENDVLLATKPKCIRNLDILAKSED